MTHKHQTINQSTRFSARQIVWLICAAFS